MYGTKPEGHPRLGSLISENFHCLAAFACLPDNRFHDLRHTVATLMLGHGIPPVIVVGMLGHTMSVLMNTYAYYIPSMPRAAARIQWVSS